MTIIHCKGNNRPDELYSLGVFSSQPKSEDTLNKLRYAAYCYHIGDDLFTTPLQIALQNTEVLNLPSDSPINWTILRFSDLEAADYWTWPPINNQLLS